jgi:hypothetical protein
MSYLGSWKIDDVLTFYANTHVFATGVATDADSAATYRVYEDETATPLLTGTMALLDSANTAGFYSEQITLSAANGFEKGKQYGIYVTATVSSVAGATNHTFQVEAEVDSNVVSDKTGYALSATGSAALTEGYAADGAAATLPQLLYLILSILGEANLSGTTITTKKLDGSTTAATFTVDSGTAPTTITRST